MVEWDAKPTLHYEKTWRLLPHYQHQLNHKYCRWIPNIDYHSSTKTAGSCRFQILKRQRPKSCARSHNMVIEDVSSWAEENSMYQSTYVGLTVWFIVTQNPCCCSIVQLLESWKVMYTWSISRKSYSIFSRNHSFYWLVRTTPLM